MTGSAARELVVWGGIPLLLAVVLCALVWYGAANLQQQGRELHQLGTRQAALYPAGAPLLPAAAARAEAQQRVQAQLAAESEARSRLCPPLPEAFRTQRFTDASGQLQRVITALRAQAERSNVALPERLPLEQGLDPDAARRSQELAQLHLLDQALRVVIGEAHNILEVSLGPVVRDPDASVAVFRAQITFAGSFAACETVMRLLGENQTGLGVAGVDLRPQGQLMACVLTVSLLTPLQEGWTDLPVASAAPSGTAGATRAGSETSNSGVRRR